MVCERDVSECEHPHLGSRCQEETPHNIDPFEELSLIGDRGAFGKFIILKPISSAMLNECY